jgi:cobalt-zinc-cadmium efflux system outer membrane protein
LIESKQAQVEAHAQYIAAVRDYWTARADLERAVGGRIADASAPSNAGAATTTSTTTTTTGAGK